MYQKLACWALFAIFCFPALSLQAALDTDLAGYWKMDDNPVDQLDTKITATVAPNGTNPLGSHGIHGEMIDTTSTGNRSQTGLIGNAVKMWEFGPSNNAYAHLGDNLQPGSESFSVNLWWNTGSTTTSQGIYNHGNWGSIVDGLSLFYLGSGKDLNVRFRSGTDNSDITLSPLFTSMKVNTWYMLTLVVDRSTDTLSLYHNGGEESDSADLTGYGSFNGAADPDSGTYFGSVVSDNTGVASLTSLMTMDEIAIWNRALTTTEITQLYNVGDGFEIPISTPGDFDGDGDVDGVDLTHATLGWEARFGDDLDGSDFLAWQRNFGTGVPLLAVAAVPEPTAFVLGCFAICALVARKR